MLVSLLKLAAAATTKVLRTAVNAKLQLNSVAVVPHDKIRHEKQVYSYTPAFLCILLRRFFVIKARQIDRYHYLIETMMFSAKVR